MREIDVELSHVWMVRTFLKHSEEAEEDDELRDVHRGLYDYMLALGGPLKDGDSEQSLLTLRYSSVFGARRKAPLQRRFRP